MRSAVTLGVFGLMIGCTRAEPEQVRSEAEPGQPSTEIGSPQPQVAPEPAPAKAEPAKVEPVTAELEPGKVEPAIAEVEAPEPVRFWVANDGLAAYDLDGKRVATLGKTSIDQARRLADGRVVGLDEDADPLALIVLAANGKVQRRVAIPDRFDPQTCKFGKPSGDPDSWPESLRMQSAYDFQLGSGAACLNLQDRNDNMMSYRVELTVDLATGGVAGTITSDIDHTCEGQDVSEGTVKASCGPDARGGEAWIEHAPAPAPDTTRFAYDFDEDQLALTRRGKPQAVLCEQGAEPERYSPSCASIESRSPSGRWLLLSGRQSDGDYIHRELVLLDRSTGVLLQIDESYPEPERLFEIEPEHLYLTSGTASPLTMVGESEVGWLPEDRLWIDGRLVIPERREIVSIGGSRVRTL